MAGRNKVDRDLDAEWKRIQKKTFTRWCNEHLKANMLKVEELTTDLSDGVKLIVLIELLSQKKIGRYNKKPRIHAQKMENVQMALDFITKKERIRLVNIGSGDIVGGNLKLILGMIWTLILHYQISIGFGLDSQKDGPSPKQALLNWLNDQIPDREVTNLTSDWHDGTLIAALVDAMAPGLCPEHTIMDPKNALQNATQAMNLADNWLGIPQLLGPEDMTNPNIDELSMMTYLSQYPDAKLKDGAPIQKKKFRKGDPNKVKVYGPGVEATGLDTNIPAAEFTVDSRSTGDGIVTATVEGPEGPVECAVELQKNGTHACSYVPTTEGDYTVNVEFNGVPIGKSPYNVHVAQGPDALACVAYGPGVEGTDLRANSPTEFWVETAGAGDGDLGISIKGPKGTIATKDLKIDKEDDDKYHVEYTSAQAGPHTIDVTYSNLHIRDSPFKVRIASDRPEPRKCKATGPGIDGTDVEINKETWFDVDTKNAGRGELSVNIKGPKGTVEAKCQPKEKGLDHFTYTPTESGEHVITVKFGGEQIPGSRFKVMVEPPTDPSKCTASGPGLAPQGVRVNEPTKFTVRTKDAGRGDVDVKISGPSGDVPFTVVKEAPHTYNYAYKATEPGNYEVDIKFADQHIPNSPYPVAITDASKVQITGPGMGGECLPVNQPLIYKIDAKEAGPGEVKCTVQDGGSFREACPTGSEETDSATAPIITANGDGTYTVEYTPTNPGLQKMNVTFSEAPIPDTPLKLSIFDASKVVASGPGLEDGNKSGQQTYFTVDMREAGEGNLDVSVDGPTTTPVHIKDQANNVVKCEYTPSVPGDYTVNVKYEGNHVPNSPFNITVQPATDPNAVRAYGPGLESTGLTTDMWAEFFVDYKNAGEGEPQVSINGPAGGEKVQEEQVEDGLKKYRYHIDPDEAGDYVIDIKFADAPIPESPFNVHADWKTDPKKVKAYGPGIEGGTSGEWTEFTIDMAKAGEGDLDLNIEGPSEAQTQVEENDNGTVTVKYLPMEAGEYKINVTFAGQPIPGAPFTPLFIPETDATKVKAYGPGLKHDGVKVGDPGDFVIDTREAGAGAVDVVVDGPYWRGRAPTPLSHTPSPNQGTTGGTAEGKPRSRNRGSISAAAKVKITSNKNDTYDVVYNPRKVGTYKVNIYFADQPIPQSPYEVNVSDPSKIKVTGPGLTKDGKKCAQAPVISVSNKEPLVWKMDCSEAGPGKVEASLVGAEGKEYDVKISEDEEDVYRLTFEPEKGGVYRLKLKYSDYDLPQNPIDFSVSNSSLVKVTGPGLDGGRIGEKMVIDLDMKDAGQGGLALSLAGPVQAKMDCDDHQDGTATLSFTPNVAGEYKLSVEFGDEHVPGSVFSIPIIDPTKCKASGSGITGVGAKVGAPAEIIVDTRHSGPAPVEATVTHPSGETTNVEFHPSDKDGVFTGEYMPEAPGHYQVEVKFADEELADSPFTVPISDPSAVTIAGPGLETAIKDVQNVIDVYTENAGPGDVGAEIKSVNSRAPPVETFVTQVSDNHYQIRYTPHDRSDVEAQITFAGNPVEDKKIIPVLDMAKVKVDGPGVKEGIIARNETEFTVDATEAGPSDLGVKVTTPDGEELETTITETKPQVWTVKYTPEKAGTHTVNVEYGNKEVQGSPFHPEVCDPDAVRCYGPGLEKATANEETKFTVDASKAGDGSLGLKIMGPEECAIEVKETPEEGVYEISYVAPRPGVYAVDVKFADKDVPGNPFEVRCERPPPDASKCKVHGLETPGQFTVDCKDAGGSGLLEVGVAGAYVPVEFVSVKHNGDFTFSVSYDISEPGETMISVKWHGQHLTGSPFTVVTK